MTRMQQLKIEAMDAVRFRGHQIDWVTKTPDRLVGICDKCHMGVYVKKDPQPNEINISGEAVALTCKGT